jgi:AraC family transcriptional regulator of adaptative response / DNA-3-methyladenine glycosylase II
MRERWLRLSPTHLPYDAERLLWYLGLHAVPGLESYSESPDGSPATYARVLRLPGGPGTVAIRPAPDAVGYDARLQLTRAGDRAVALAQVRRLLDLDADPGPAARHLAADPVIGPSLGARPGLRMAGSVDHVETLVRTVIGQQISLAGARTVTGQVVAALGQPLPAQLATDGLSAAFPTAAALAAAEPEHLPMPRARGRSLVAIGRAMLVQGEQLAAGSTATRDALLALPGVGPWTADYLALRVARDPDVFLPTDLAVRRALERHGLAGDPASAATAALAWAPYRSTALTHLWTDLLESRRG